MLVLYSFLIVPPPLNSPFPLPPTALFIYLYSMYIQFLHIVGEKSGKFNFLNNILNITLLTYLNIFFSLLCNNIYLEEDMMIGTVLAF